jgi:diguanylate cyclase (GGDEF)-like protein
MGFDIERRKTLEQQLAFQAFNDPLTGLANRRRFIATAKSALDDSGSLGALFVDLDDFKNVNDHGGHDAGDALLVAVGMRLLASVREDDLVGRLGGDEFCVLLRNVESVAAAEEIAARLVQALTLPMPGDGHVASISASIGLALRQPSETMEVDELLRRADVAMYQAKARGKNRCATYAADMDIPAPVSSKRPAVRRAVTAA